MRLKVLSYNIHKGFNWSNSELTINNIKQTIQATHAELVFLQEVVGENKVEEEKYHHWKNDQYEFLADQRWPEYAYAKNAVYDYRHHGNAVLSKYPITRYEQINISTNKYEQRGVLFCELELPHTKVHAYCVHLNLLHRSRLKQYKMISDLVKERTPAGTPVIIAGDFNDWNRKASNTLEQEDGFLEAYKYLHGEYPKTFPAQYPLLSLDRMYVKEMNPEIVKVLNSHQWKKLSDHAALYMEAVIP
tara:strand:+ start:169 stop:906 length:738 start_codon:yes stop_codon:yes gene_type:complete